MNNFSIFVLEAAPQPTQDLALELGHFAYQAKSFAQVETLVAAIQQAPPLAVIVDPTIFADDAATNEGVALIRGARKLPIPLIFVCDQDTFDGRLRAVRAGALAFLPRPVEIGELVAVLDQLQVNDRADPYHVMIVEDDRLAAMLSAAVLRSAGINSTIVVDPIQTLALMPSPMPDLIIADMNMPGCNGRELTAVLRQYPDFRSIPIVFLSGDTNTELQLETLQWGGDGFLSKPVRAEQLLAAVVSRIRRHRLARRQTMYDGLTGLFSKTHFQEALLQLIGQGQALSLVLLALDEYEQMNASYGDAAGDRVLQNLALLLQRRLPHNSSCARRLDSGVAILLPDFAAPSALPLINDIRQSFTQIRHRPAGVELVATFSGGIADFPRHTDARSLFDAATHALDDAQQAGGNRLVLNSLALQPRHPARHTTPSLVNRQFLFPPPIARRLAFRSQRRCLSPTARRCSGRVRA